MRNTVLATFSDGRQATYSHTDEMIWLLMTDQATVEIMDIATGEILYEKGVIE